MPRLSRRSFIRYTITGTGVSIALTATGTPGRLLAAAGPETYRLRILHTNDHHARIEPLLNSDNTVLHAGVSRRKRLIDTIRNDSADQNLILIDAGDVFQGTLWYNRYNGMADLEFYNAMGYQAMAIGNHEYDRGQLLLSDFVRAANFPVLSANTVVEPTSPLSGLIKANTIIERGGQKIGIFGLTTEETAILSNPGAGVRFTPAIEAARQQVAALQAAGVNKIIALTHVGINVDRELARTVAGIDVIVGGHSHTPMGPMINPPVASRPYPELIAAPDGNPVVVVTDWEWGRWLGDITIGFDANGVVTSVSGNPTEVNARIEADPGFEARIATLRQPLDELRRTRVGETTVSLNGARADVRSKETNLGNLVADAMLEKSRPAGGQIAIMNGGGIRTSIPAGQVTVGQVLEVLPFGNTLAQVDLTGAQVRAALENGVSQVETGAGRFPQVAGVRFTFNPAAAANSRVLDVLVSTGSGFQAIDPAATYRVITNNFMLTGGDGYSVFTQGRNQLDLGFILADVVQDYIAARSPVTATTDGRIATATAASAPATAPVTAPVTDPVSAPAVTPLPADVSAPVSLPNTGSEITPIWMLAALGAGALGSGLALRRRAQHSAEANQAAAPRGNEQE